MFENVMQVYLVILSVCVTGALVYIAINRHITDRLVGVNLVCTLILNLILVTSLFLNATSILDIDIIYALLSFQAVVVLSRMMRVRMLTGKKKKGREKK